MQAPGHYSWTRPPRRRWDRPPTGRAGSRWTMERGAAVQHMVRSAGHKARTGRDRPGIDLQHHLLVGHHRNAEGHRAFPRSALAAIRPARIRSATARTRSTLLSTPLYSNTTLVCFNPTLAGGGTVVLMKKFDARGFLELSAKHRVTHAMLVPVQYRRIMDAAGFRQFRSLVVRDEVLAPRRRSPRH